MKLSRILLLSPALIALAACSDRSAPVPVIVADAMHLASTGASAGEQPLTRQIFDSNSSAESGMEICANAAIDAVPGHLVQVGLKRGQSSKVWEFEVRSAEGPSFDVECADDSGKILATDRRVPSADHEEFAAAARIDAAAARKIALTAQPGAIEQVRYEVSPDGKPLYKFAIRADSGNFQVKVDAATGAVIGAAPQLLEIGAL